jgi:hypothetical protein
VKIVFANEINYLINKQLISFFPFFILASFFALVYVFNLLCFHCHNLVQFSALCSVLLHHLFIYMKKVLLLLFFFRTCFEFYCSINNNQLEIALIERNIYWQSQSALSSDVLSSDECFWQLCHWMLSCCC